MGDNVYKKNMVIRVVGHNLLLSTVKLSYFRNSDVRKNSIVLADLEGKTFLQCATMSSLCKLDWSDNSTTEERKTVEVMFAAVKADAKLRPLDLESLMVTPRKLRFRKVQTGEASDEIHSEHHTVKRQKTKRHKTIEPQTAHEPSKKASAKKHVLTAEDLPALVADVSAVVTRNLLQQLGSIMHKPEIHFAAPAADGPTAPTSGMFLPVSINIGCPFPSPFSPSGGPRSMRARSDLKEQNAK